ncbi:helix-turn-helix domain-containing protein [Nonomuraea angiospora]|uniref:helix-turn-helix domain-containing protein n=1 Tax=Nonomuraea angiospora TaxID=46172 RepID=UPI0029A78F4C|nr:helix-turn-helix transcriptional regulator [Nonomuraea angiospora]MDX3109562.1 helix-turn-helix transcriptional regulator [Nonomuraea angiospora]
MSDSTEVDPEAVRIGATIRALRNALGWTITELAAAVGKSHAYICNIEAGRKRCPGKLARQVADALGVPVGAIVSPGYDTEALTAQVEARPA